MAKWEFDTGQSRIGFTVRHMVVSKVRGRFTRWSGSMEASGTRLETSRVYVNIESASIETGDSLRDAYVKSPDFLAVENHPHIHFTSTRVEPKGMRKFAVAGELAIRTVRREVLLAAFVNGRDDAPWSGSTIRLTATTKIDRKSYGLEWNRAIEAAGLLVSDTVDVEIDVIARKRGR
jgi:polyisoprenoid-binding protein YceI